MAEQGPYKAEVDGSNPSVRTIMGAWRSWLARLGDIEKVVGPNPSAPTWR